MNQSLSFKFNILNSVIVLILLLGFGMYNYSADKKALYKQLDQQVSAASGRLQTSLPITLWNFELEQMEGIIVSEAAADYVKGIYVYDDKKQVMGMAKDEAGKLAKANLSDESAEGLVERQLTYAENGNAPIGRVVLQMDATSVEALLHDSLVRQIVQIVVMIMVLVACITALMNKIVVQPLHEVLGALSDIAKGEGDLTKRLDASSEDEIGAVAREFNYFVEKIRAMVQQMIEAANHLIGSTSSMEQYTAQTNQAVSSQTTEIEQVATAMNEMTATALDVSKNANEAASAAQHAHEDGRKALDVLNQTIDNINHLASEIESSSQVIHELELEVGNITSVLDVIRGIAEQTNLLALNAAIEAARAGEQGRGFAVVADEVRTLASKTQASTEEIQDMIVRLQSGTGQAVDAMMKSKEKGEQTVQNGQTAGQSLNQIADAIGTINDMNAQIASAAEEQTAVSEEINRSLVKISDMADESARGAEETCNASNALSALGSEIKQAMGQFKV